MVKVVVVDVLVVVVDVVVGIVVLLSVADSATRGKLLVGVRMCVLTPVPCRCCSQGISAAAGKVGAIIADVVFSYITQRMTFILSGGGCCCEAARAL
jgi:hypothetical protein